MINRIQIMIEGQEITLEVLGAYVIDENIYLLMGDNSNKPYAFRILPSGMRREATLDSALANLHINELAQMRSAMAPKRPIELHVHVNSDMESAKFRELIDGIRE